MPALAPPLPGWPGLLVTLEILGALRPVLASTIVPFELRPNGLLPVPLVVRPVARRLRRGVLRRSGGRLLRRARCPVEILRPRPLPVIVALLPAPAGVSLIDVS